MYITAVNCLLIIYGCYNKNLENVSFIFVKRIKIFSLNKGKGKVVPVFL